MTAYERLLVTMPSAPATWLVTGAAGFIGSNLSEALLGLGQRVVGLDNLATGHRSNLEQVRSLVSAEQWARFEFIEGDIRNPADCNRACEGVRHVLHQAALGSVPRSLADPRTTNDTNIGGFLNMMLAARDAGVQSFTYASSSSTYGDYPGLPKVEDQIGKPLSPYAVSKDADELYATAFARSFGFEAIGLRYFNVFGPRQDPDGPYAAVIPRWIAAMIKGQDVFINGDGETSRDFCFVGNAVQANLLAAVAEGPGARDQVYNVAVGGRATLNDLFQALRASLAQHGVSYDRPPVYREFRAGDVRHSQADIGKARRLLGYEPRHDLRAGIQAAMPWYLDLFDAVPAPARRDASPAGPVHAGGAS